MQSIDYSVVIPVFQGEDTLEELFTGIHQVFDALNASFEVVFVEDGGKDRSWEVITRLKAAHPKLIKGIKLAKNFGQHNATLCGMNFARGNWVITIDDDLQTPPSEIPKLISCHQENQCDLVYGFYKNKRHSYYRNLGSRFIKKSSKAIGDAPGEGSSFRLITKELYHKLKEHNQNFIFIDELLLWYTEDIDFVEVEHHKSKASKSRYTFFKLLQLTLNLILNYTTVPLKIMTIGGFLMSFVSFLIGLRFILRKIFFDVPLGYTSIIVSIFFTTSMILFSLGMIGEYLKRLYIMQNKKPPYSIKKILD